MSLVLNNITVIQLELNKYMLNEWRREGKKEGCRGRVLSLIPCSIPGKIWIIIFTTQVLL